MEHREFTIALREENIEFRDKIAKLERGANIKQNLEYQDGEYYLKKRNV